MSSFLPLGDGITYVDGWAGRHTIGGTCRDYPDWCWSLQGEWFERATGRAVAYRPSTGKHEVISVPTWRHLWKRANE